jgi:hypothetical protein
VAVGIAVAVAWALMDRASQAEDRGSIDGYDAEALACFFGCDAQDVDGIVEAMVARRILADGKFVAWDKRQPSRERPEDISTERSRRFRERHATPRNASEHQETPGNATQRLDKDSDTDTESEKKESLASLASRAKAEFDDTFWPAYPNKVGKPKAASSFATKRKTYDLDAIMAGLDRYKRDKPGDRPWLNPATFLNQERFNDEPGLLAVATRSTGPPQGGNPLTAGFRRQMDILARRGEANGKDQDHGQASGAEHVGRETLDLAPPTRTP